MKNNISPLNDIQHKNNIDLAEVTITMFSNCANRQAYLNRKKYRFSWKLRSWRKLFSTTGKKYGFVGFGCYSRYVAKSIKQLGLPMFAYSGADENLKIDDVEVKNVATLEELFRTCDYISIHDASTDLIDKIFTNRYFGVMKDDSIVVISENMKINESLFVDYKC